MVVVADGRSLSRAFYVHSTAPSSTAQGISIGILRLAYKVHALLEARGFSADVFLPSHLVRRTVFHGHVPLALLADVTEALNLFDRQGAHVLHLAPTLTPGSSWLKLWVEPCVLAVHTRYLLRTKDFSTAVFCAGAAQLHEALTQVLNW